MLTFLVLWAVVLVSKSYGDLQCVENPVDLVFIIDSSSSIFPNEYVRQLEFLETIAGALDVGHLQNQSRVGVISFSDEPRLEFTLNQYTERSELIAAIRRINYLFGGTNTAAAIQLALETMFNEESGAREEAKDIIIVITDGESFSESATKASAQKARELGIFVLAIGVGVNVNVRELNLITGNPEHVYQVLKFEDLRDITETLINKTCTETFITTSLPAVQKDLPHNESSTFESCDEKPADVLFLLDSSSSIHRNDFKKQLNFVKTIVSAFDIGPEKTTVGVSTFSDDFRLVFNLNDFTTKEDILGAVDNVPYLRGGTDTGFALKNIREYGFRLARSNVAHILIVVTDGLSRDPSDTLLQASLLKEIGINIFAIGVGPFIDKKELISMASSPTEDLNFVFDVSTYDALKSVENLLAKRTCQIAAKQMDSYALCIMEKPVDILFVFDSAAIGYQDTKLILNIIKSFQKLRFENAADIHVGVVSYSCTSNGDFPFQPPNDNLLISFDKFASLLKRAKTFKNSARSNAVRVMVLLIDRNLTNEDELEILEIKTVVDRLYMIYLGEYHTKENTLTISSLNAQSVFVKSMNETEDLSNYLQNELCFDID